MTKAQTPGQIFHAMQAGKFTTLAKITPRGSLQLRKLKNGSGMFYWRTEHNGKELREPIGAFDTSAPPKSVTPTDRGYSFNAAVRAAEVVATAHLGNIDSGGYQSLKTAKRKEQTLALQKAQELEEHTLEKLLIAYCDLLQDLGKTSHQEARNVLKLHVMQAFPRLAQTPASHVTTEQVADVMRRLVQDGKRRTANKLRSYMRAAYECAKSAKTNPSIPLSFKGFGIASNPVSDTAPDPHGNQADKNPINFGGLQTYWRHIKNLNDYRSALLRFHLATGGQRIAQLVRLTNADVYADHFVLHDPKGRTGQRARTHIVPLTREAKLALEQCRANGPLTFTSDGGKTHISATTLSGWAQDAARAAGLVNFQAKQIRSGIETLLASAGISSDIRGRLQSHGISGIQNRHYNAYEYMSEKLLALEKLIDLLERN
ncbi:UNVERIFIED_ORG: integrase [Comamonas terrigena]